VAPGGHHQAAMNPKPPKSPRLMSANFQGNMFNHLPDELVVHMCRYMDSYSLLKFGRSSSRLYNIVCTLEVWRRLLRGIEDFTEAKVRMLMFFANRGNFLYMMTEVLREIASRNLFSVGQDIVRVRVTIGGWCFANTYDLCADALKRLLMVEEESGARMLLKEVKEFEGSKHAEYCRTRTLSSIGDHVKMQQDEVGYFEVGQFRGHWDNLQILRKSQKWLIHELYMADWFVHQLTMDQVKRHWRYLANSAAGGQIEMLLMSQNTGQPIYEEILESVRKVWEIADNVKIKLGDKSQIVMRGGRSGVNPAESWLEFKAALQL